MAFKKVLCVLSLVCVISAQAGIAQDTGISQLPSSDPFSLSPGTSFSASGRRPAGSSAARSPISRDLEEALDLIVANHASGPRLNKEALTESAITSMLHVLDPHSNFYNPDEYQDLLGEHESEYTGTGSSIAGFERNGRIDTFIVSTFPNSPAARAGLRFGDRIIAVDGQLVSGEVPDTVRDLVRGKRGSLVRMTVERADGGKVDTLELKRDRVHEPAVPKGFLLKGNVGYIDLTNGFSNATFREFEVALDDLKRRGMTSLVLDIRGNGGGILDQAVKVAEKFLPAGTTIVSQRGRYPEDNRTWKASKPRYESVPLVVLVDESSASASEVLAGALQDNDRALIIGRKTFGKGLVQSVLNLPDGAGLTLTAARYYTPTGRSIQRDYAEVGLYDYYNHRTVEIDKPLYAARTITNRVVYGGDGITPDEISSGRELTPARLRLLDPIFFFSRELLSLPASAEPTAIGPQPAQKLRHRILFGETLIDDEVLRMFDEFIRISGEWSELKTEIAGERPFVAQMLAYYLSIGTFGVDAANRARIEADPVVATALNRFPRAAQLAAAAFKARNTAPKRKKLAESGSRRAKVETGGIRKTTHRSTCKNYRQSTFSLIKRDACRS